MSLNGEKHDMTPEERALQLIKELSLEEKMAQINCVFPFDKTYLDMDWIRNQIPYGIGEVSTLEMRRMETLDEAAKWINNVQKMVMEQSPHHIPAIFHMEGLCGAFIQEASSFPAGIGRGASFDVELEEEIAKCVATQEAACGITHILARFLMYPEIPEWEDGEKLTEKIQPLRQQWELPTQKEFKIPLLTDEDQRVLQSTFLLSIILRVESTEHIVKLRNALFEKFMGNLFRPPLQKVA